MIRKNWIVLALIVSLMFSIGCGDPKKNGKPFQLDPKKVENTLAELHKKNIKIEDQQIDDYLNRRGWDFTRTKSGLRYKIYKEGIGLKPKEGQGVVLEYQLNLIRGELIYDSKKDGVKMFTVGEADEPTGLQEVVQLMEVGSRAKVILPSYLAYGAVGDENKIPPRATLFYDLYLKEIH